MRLELTHRGDYAIRAMIALSHSDRDRLSVRRIAEEMHIPVAFLPQVMRDLVAAGLVESASGRSGGYRLARTAAERRAFSAAAHAAATGTATLTTCSSRHSRPCSTGSGGPPSPTWSAATAPRRSRRSS